VDTTARTASPVGSRTIIALTGSAWGPQGPPSAQIAYPYYILLDNPPSIGR
jgi:hypothetical protein